MAIKKKKKSRKDEEDIPLVGMLFICSYSMLTWENMFTTWNKTMNISVVYTTYIGAVPQALSHCKWLEQMFKSLNVRYKKVDLGVHKDMVTFVRQTSGKRELPQVFINNIYIGVGEAEDLMVSLNYIIILLSISGSYLFVYVVSYTLLLALLGI